MGKQAVTQSERLADLPQWRLPAGVTRAMWQYARAGHIAHDYDAYFAWNIPKMFLHVYTRRELVADLKQAGFRIVELISLDTQRRHALRWPWLLGRLRANGWIAVCARKPEI